MRDLTATALTHRSIKLRWTAPGDDGLEGRAKRYDIRYSTEPFPAGDHFPPLDTVASPPPPALAEQPDSVVVAGLRPSTRYYFAMRVADEKGNLSPRSNVATNLTLASPDTIPPATTTDLHVVVAINTSITLGWTAPGDDGQVGTATSYDLRYSASPIDENNWVTATRVGNVPTPGAPGAGQSCQVLGLSPDRSYHFALRTSDESGNVSELSPPFQAATTRPRVWRIRADGSGDEPTIQAGINTAFWGDTVRVEPGLYGESITFVGRDIVVESEAGSERTTIDGSGQPGAVVSFSLPQSAMCVLEGFTILGGQSRWGGGISCTGGSPTIRRNTIRNNSAQLGGGIFVGTEDLQGRTLAPLIDRNVIQANTASIGGGGIAILAGTAVNLRGNLIVSNTAAFDGGGLLALLGDDSLMVIQNHFTRNIAGDKGGGMNLSRSGADPGPCLISRNFVVGNKAFAIDNTKRGAGGGVTVDGMNGLIENNTIIFNSGVDKIHDSAGGLLVLLPCASLQITRNLIAYNDNTGVACYEGVAASFSGNLLWANRDSDLASGERGCPAEWLRGVIEVDPLFCTSPQDSTSLCGESPALAASPPIGAATAAGCSNCGSTPSGSPGSVSKGSPPCN